MKNNRNFVGSEFKDYLFLHYNMYIMVLDVHCLGFSFRNFARKS